VCCWYEVELEEVKMMMMHEDGDEERDEGVQETP
jgi:hypothetical protein